jgi:dUTPase
LTDKYQATVINLTSSEITIPKGKQLMEAVIFKAFNIPIDAI